MSSVALIEKDDYFGPELDISIPKYKIKQGVYSVFVTPFNSDERKTINYSDIDNWLDHQSKSHVTGYVLMGTTSESPTISRTEQLNIINYIVAKNNMLEKPKYIIIGVGGNDTMETYEFSKMVYSLGQALMVTVPSYNKPTQKGIIQHFSMFKDLNIPIMMYNVPARTGVNMLPETMKIIMEKCENVVALKEASGNIEQLITIKSLMPNLQVFCGDDNLLLDFIVHGCDGVISVASNVIPKFVCMLYYAGIDDIEIARNLYYHNKYNEFVKSLFIESNPIPVKFMLQQLNIYGNFVMRLPLTPLDEKHHEYVSGCLNKFFKF